MSFFKKIFTAPVFDDELKTQQAYLLHIILWTLVCVPIPFLIYSLALTPEISSRTLIQTVSGEIANIILLLMLRRGYVRATSIMQVSAFWFFFTVTASTGNGVQGEPYLLGYGLVIVIAGILLGGTGALIFTFMSLAAGGWMVYGQTQGFIISSFDSAPVTTWVVSLVLFPVSAVLQHLASRTLRLALARARASEEKYRLISQVSSDYTFSTDVDLDGKMQLNWVAGAFEKITGYTREEYIANGGWLAHLHHDDIEKDAQDLAVLQKKQSVISELRTRRRGGSLRWVQVSADSVWDDQQNRLRGIVGAVKDITERKQAEEALRESESIYRQAIVVAGAVPYRQTFDKEGRIIYEFMGEGIRQITGYGPEEFSDDLWDSLVQERQLLEDLAPYSLDDAIQQVRLGKTPVWKCEHLIKARDGKIHWVFEAAIDLRDEHGIAHGSIGLYQDITERKRTEEALKYERDLLQIFMDNIPDLIYFKDIESRFVRINEAHAQFLGVDSPQDAIGKTDLDFQNPKLARELLLEEKQIIETGQPLWNHAEFNPTKDGKLRWLSTTKVPAKNEFGQIIGTIGISRNITAQKQIEEALTYERDLLQIFMDNIPDTIYFKDTGSRFVRINQAQARLLNIDNPESAIGKTDLDFQDSELAQKFMAEEKQILETGQPIFNRIEFNPTTDGKPRWLSASKVPIKDRAGQAIGIIGISRDVTEQKLAAELEQKRSIMLEKVIQLGKQVAKSDNLRTTIHKIWHGVHNDLEFDRLAIFLYNPEHNSMDDTVGTNNSGEMVGQWGISFPIDSTFAALLQNPNGVYSTQAYDIENKIPEGHEMYGVKDYVAVAAWAGDKPVAVICADQYITHRPITPEQLEALRLFGGYAGLAIENARLNEKIKNELSLQIQAKEREEHRRAILEKVINLGVYITEVTDLRTTLVNIWHGIRYDLGFDRLAIFLYNPVQKSMDGTFGTNNQGEMTDDWHISHPLNEENNPSSKPFLRVLEKPDTIYFTRNFEEDYKIPQGHIMAGVKDFASIAAWAGEKPVAFISVDHVITGRPISEEQLEALRLFAGYAGLAIENARLNSALEAELAQRKNFIVELEAKNAELERFTYTVSHDLKSPLVTIKGFLGYLEKDALEGNFEKLKHDKQRIETAVEKMQNLLQDLLELSRIGRLMNTPVEIPFDDIVRDALEIVHGQIKIGNVRIEQKSNHVSIKCDRIRITEVLQNLIDNAIKFMGTQPNPQIEIGAFLNDNHENVLYVKDNGMGIAPEYHGKIFGLFDKLTVDSEGTGIGLALVKRIIEVHGGRIWVESQIGQGTTFFFTLP